MTETAVENPFRVFIFAASAVVCFSLMNAFVKIAAADYSMAQLIFFRNFLAFFPILYMVSRNGGFGILKTDNHIGHFWRGFIGVAGMLCFFISFKMLPLTDATSIHFASPLILTALSVPMLGEKVGKYRWGAVIIGLAGVLYMLQPSGQADFAGSMIALLAAFLAALAMVSVRQLGRSEHALTIAFYFTVYGTLLGGSVMAFMWQPIQADTFYFLVMIGFLGGVGQVLLTYAYAHAPAAFVAPFSYLAIIAAVVFDILLWSHWPAMHTWIGSIIVMGSGLFIVYRESVKKKKVQVARTNLYGVQPAMPTEADEK